LGYALLLKATEAVTAHANPESKTIFNPCIMLATTAKPLSVAIHSNCSKGINI
jgi:hypothetical protein